MVKVNFSDSTTDIFDRAIYAIGGTTPKEFLKSCGIELDAKGNPIFDRERHETAIEWIIYCRGYSILHRWSIAIALKIPLGLLEICFQKLLFGRSPKEGEV